MMRREFPHIVRVHTLENSQSHELAEYMVLKGPL